MGLKLHGMAAAGCTQRVLYVASECGLTVDVVKVDLLKGEHKKPEYLKMQPFGEIPVLEDDGFMVYETRAIAQYLCDKAGAAGNKIFPTDLKKRAIVQQMISVETSNYDSAISPLVRETKLKKLHGGEPDPVKVKAYRETLEKCLDVYENILAKQPYVCGQEFTIADIFHVPAGEFIVEVGQGDLFEKRPNVCKWWKAISSRPAWTAVKAMK